ncbi:MAG: APC family permease [Armatimonadota bacterium]
MFQLLKRIIIGSPLHSSRAKHERLSKIVALPVFASDALSSVAYATEEILIVLVLAGTAFLDHSVQISVGIVALLAVVAISYRQTIHAYPSGGGSYIVAKENLGKYPGLTAGAALMIDYVLTVAVSISAGVAALVSWHPALAAHRVEICLLFIAIIALANLRGLRESGALFALPTYTFVFSIFALIAAGIYRLHTTGLYIPSSEIKVVGTHPFTIFLVLRAFAGGCTAMTGTEAISNGIPAFRAPESKNAAATLVWMAVILGSVFIGISYIARKTGVTPLENETVISQIARAIFYTNAKWMYVLIQLATAAILVLAANTSFADFPRLGSIMSRDRFLPRQLYNVGDRLVFSNGILLLAGIAAALVVAFHGDTHALIPLYAVGVFLSFTLSQSGMVVHLARLRERGWQRSAVLSTLGAITTGAVTVVIAVTKFTGGEWSLHPFHITPGAWIVVLLIPTFVYIFSRVNAHYVELGNELRLNKERDAFVETRDTVLVLTPSLHRGILPALKYAKGLSADVRALHIDTDPVDRKLLEERWDEWGGGLPLVILESPYRSLVGPLIKYIRRIREEEPRSVITIVIPEFVSNKWWHRLLHNQSGLQLKLALLNEPNVVTANLRYHVKRSKGA